MRIILPSHRIAPLRHRNKHLKRRNVVQLALFVMGMVWWQLQTNMMAFLLWDTSPSQTLHNSQFEQLPSTLIHSSNHPSSSQVQNLDRIPLLAESRRRVVVDYITAHVIKKLQQVPRESSSDEEQSNLRKPQSTSAGEGRSNADRARAIIPSSTLSKLVMLLMNKRDPPPQEWSTEQLIDVEGRVDKHVDTVLKNYSACTGKSAYLKLVFSGDL